MASMAMSGGRHGVVRYPAALWGGVSPLLLLLAACAGGDATAEAAQRPLVLNAGVEQVDPANHLDWLRDGSGRLALDDILSGQVEFSALAPGDLPAHSNDPHWLRLTLQPAPGASGEWLIEIAYTQLDEVTLYTRRGKGSWRTVQTGDHRPFATRDIAHPNFVFSLPTEPGDVTEIYLRVRTATSLVVPVTLWRADAFQRHNMKVQLVRGLYYGLLLALALYNLFLYPTVRDSSYLFYVAYLTSIGGFQFAHEGLAFMYLWPEAPALADRAVTIALSLSYVAGLQFARHMVRTNHFAPRVDQVMRYFAWIAIAPALLAVAAGPGRFFLLLPLLAAVVIVLIFTGLINAWRGGFRPARWVLLAFSALLPGGILLVLRSLELVEASFWTEHLLQIGSGIEAVLLSFALADRFDLLRYEKESVQNKLLAVEKSARQAQQRFSRQLIDAQDRERARLAKDLHDGLGQHLSLIKNSLWRLRGNKKAEIPQGLMDAASEAIHEVRDVTHRLHPHLLDRLGLQTALESMVERTLSALDIECELEMDDITGLLTRGEELHIYRIVQESLSNILRHSGARRVWISLRCDDQLQLRIRDDGHGRRESGWEPGAGLVNIAERARALEGEAFFESVADGGFQIFVVIPMKSGVGTVPPS